MSSLLLTILIIISVIEVIVALAGSDTQTDIKPVQSIGWRCRLLFLEEFKRKQNIADFSDFSVMLRLEANKHLKDITK